MTKRTETPVIVTRDGAPAQLVQRVEGTLYRAAEATASIESEDDRIVLLSFSSEQPYTRYSFFEDPWVETLGHEDGEVDLSRLNSRAPLLYNHMRTRADRIGSVIEAWVENGRGYARVQFSKRADIEDIWGDTRDGHLPNVSVGYMIHERKLTQENGDGPDEFRVTRWEPLEVSIVDIPADPTVGVGRSADGGQPDNYYRVIDITNRSEDPEPSNEETQMTEKTKEQPPGKDPAASEIATRDADLEEVRRQAADEAKRKERDRRSEVRRAFEHVDLTDELRDLRDELLEDDKATFNTAAEKVLEVIGRGKCPSGVPSVMPGQDHAEKFREGATRGILTRSGDKSGDAREETGNEYRGLTLVELARESLKTVGLDHRGDRMIVVGRALTMRSAIGHSTSDFPQLLADVANKQMLKGYSESGETWNRWATVGNLQDFKTARRVGLNAFEDLEQVREGGAYKYGTFTDRGETIQLATYGKIFPITRQAIINDDLQAFTRVPFLMGRAAARVPGDLAYAVLTTNAALSDGTALFHSDHGNLGTGGAISATTVGEARNLMALQTSGGANGLNIQLGYLLVPVQLRDTAQVLATSEFDPADGTNNNRAPNPVRGAFEVVADPRLSADDVAQWYAAATQDFDTVEVAFLDGNQEPRIEEQPGWTVDGVEYKVALDCAAAALDFRGLVRNAGS